MKTEIKKSVIDLKDNKEYNLFLDKSRKFLEKKCDNLVIKKLGSFKKDNKTFYITEFYLLFFK